MIGNDQWHDYDTFLIEQTGSRTWQGKVMFWRESDGESKGRRDPYITNGNGQWEAGDTIKLSGKCG